MGPDLLLYLVVASALAFDFTNGFRDTANAMASAGGTATAGWTALAALALGVSAIV